MPAIPPFAGASEAESVSADISEGILTHIAINNENTALGLAGAPYVEAYLCRGGSDTSYRLTTLTHGIATSVLSPSWHGMIETRAGDTILVRGRGAGLENLRINYEQLTLTGETPLTKYVQHLTANH